MNQKNNVFSYLILSFAAACLLLILVFFSPSNNSSINTFDKALFGGLFSIICIFGISLAFYPGWYKKTLKRGKYSKDKQQTQKIKRMRVGHHPDCEQFQKHIIKTKNKSYCAGCLGLAIGLIISILFMIIYVIFSNFSFNYLFFVFIGLIIVFLVYFEIFFPIKNAIIHMISNAIFVLGFFLITIGILEITGSIVYSFITILFLFLFLDTRVQISSYRHNLICDNCKEKCKIY